MKNVFALLVLVMTELSLLAQKEFVDLGLSVIWATSNIGAKAPEE